jgi:hypothetical protein
MAEEASKKCFIISPIGPDDSDIRTAADFFREDIVKATLGNQFEVKRADDYPNAGNITSQVIVAIRDADLIVADLTGRNANVYYELGVAHSYKKHVVPMINRDLDPNQPPFDNHAERTIPYSLKTVAARKAACELLTSAVEATLKGKVSNPVTTALGLAQATAEGDNTGQLLDQLMRTVVSMDLRLDTQARQIQQLTTIVVRQPTPQEETSLLGDLLGAALAKATSKPQTPPSDFLTGRPQGLADAFDPTKVNLGLISSPLTPSQPGMRPPPDPRPPKGGKK